MSVRLWIPGDNPVAGTNDFYSAGHWNKRNRLAADGHAYIVGIALDTLGIPIEPFPGPVSVTITAYATHPRDPDNLPKLLLDGLVCAGVIEDDDYQHVRELTLRSRRPNGRDPGIEIIVEEWKG